MSEETTPESSSGGCTTKGCLLWGCVSVIVVSVIVAALAAFAVNKAIAAANEYLDDKPAAFTLPAPSPEETAAAEEKAAALDDAIKNGNPASIRFSDAEINALISQGLAKQGTTKLKTRVTIADGKATGEISIPIEEILPQAKNKFLNGTATFEIHKAQKSDRLDVRITALNVKGEPLPPDFLSQISKENLANDVYVNPQNRDTRAILDAIDRIEILDDQILFEILPPSPQPPQP